MNPRKTRKDAKKVNQLARLRDYGRMINYNCSQIPFGNIIAREIVFKSNFFILIEKSK